MITSEAKPLEESQISAIQQNGGTKSSANCPLLEINVSAENLLSVNTAHR